MTFKWYSIVDLSSVYLMKYFQDLLATAHEVEEKKLVQEKKLEKFEKELQKVDSKTLEVRL